MNAEDGEPKPGLSLSGAPRAPALPPAPGGTPRRFAGTNPRLKRQGSVGIGERNERGELVRVGSQRMRRKASRKSVQTKHKNEPEIPEIPGNDKEGTQEHQNQLSHSALAWARHIDSSNAAETKIQQGGQHHRGDVKGEVPQLASRGSFIGRNLNKFKNMGISFMAKDRKRRKEAAKTGFSKIRMALNKHGLALRVKGLLPPDHTIDTDGNVDLKRKRLDLASIAMQAVESDAKVALLGATFFDSARLAFVIVVIAWFSYLIHSQEFGMNSASLNRRWQNVLRFPPAPPQQTSILPFLQTQEGMTQFIKASPVASAWRSILSGGTASTAIPAFVPMHQVKDETAMWAFFGTTLPEAVSRTHVPVGGMEHANFSSLHPLDSMWFDSLMNANVSAADFQKDKLIALSPAMTVLYKSSTKECDYDFVMDGNSEGDQQPVGTQCVDWQKPDKRTSSSGHQYFAQGSFKDIPVKLKTHDITIDSGHNITFKMTGGSSVVRHFQNLFHLGIFDQFTTAIITRFASLRPSNNAIVHFTVVVERSPSGVLHAWSSVDSGPASIVLGLSSGRGLLLAFTALLGVAISLNAMMLVNIAMKRTGGVSGKLLVATDMIIYAFSIGAYVMLFTAFTTARLDQDAWPPNVDVEFIGYKFPRTYLSRWLSLLVATVGVCLVRLVILVSQGFPVAKFAQDIFFQDSGIWISFFWFLGAVMLGFGFAWQLLFAAAPYKATNIRTSNYEDESDLRFLPPLKRGGQFFTVLWALILPKFAWFSGSNENHNAGFQFRSLVEFIAPNAFWAAILVLASILLKALLVALPFSFTYHRLVKTSADSLQPSQPAVQWLKSVQQAEDDEEFKGSAVVTTFEQAVVLSHAKLRVAVANGLTTLHRLLQKVDLTAIEGIRNKLLWAAYRLRKQRRPPIQPKNVKVEEEHDSESASKESRNSRKDTRSAWMTGKGNDVQGTNAVDDDWDNETLASQAGKGPVLVLEIDSVTQRVVSLHDCLKKLTETLTPG